MTTSSRLLALALLVGGAHVASPAVAAPSSVDLESARELWREGKKLRDAGKLVEALEKFRAAWALAPTPVTGVDFAKTLAALGRLVEARDVALQVAKLPVAPAESANAQAAREEADALATSLKARIPSLVPKLADADPAGVKVLVDEAEIPSAALGQPRRVDPGTHVVRVLKDDKELARVEVKLAEGETREVVLTVPKGTTETSKPPAVPTPAPPPPAGPAVPEPARIPTWGFVGLGVGVAGVVVGGVAGVVAWSRLGKAKDQCASDKSCPPEASSDLDTSRRAGNVSTLAFVVGGVGLAAFGVSLLVRERPVARVGLVVVPGVAGVSLGGAF